MQMSHLVCAVDFSAQSDRALQIASTLAKESGGVLHIIHSYEQPFAYDPQLPEYVPPPADLDEIKKRLHDQQPVHSDIEVVYELLVGEPAAAIQEYADKIGADLIVMGTHGRSGVARFLMGSIAESVLRHAACPVLVIKAS
jgi:nucleotide-binding universal stress UspA family protein